jgi:maleylacetate reductase
MKSRRCGQAFGPRFAGIFDRMPPHTPRSAVIAAAAAAREAGADLLVTIGGGSTTDGGKAVQLCLANDIRTSEALDAFRPVSGHGGVLGPPPCNPPSVRQITVPTTLSAGEFSAIAGVTDEAAAGEGAVPPSADHPARSGSGSSGDPAHARVAVAVDRHSRGRPLR